MPNWSYVTNYPVALGDIDSLGSLRMRADLCGHVLTVNCGKGDIDVIINNSNFGGGLDLYASSWDRATGNLPPGVTSCNVFLSTKNAMGGNSPLCFYATGETDNRYYHKLGLLNTGARIVSGASLKGTDGSHDAQNNPYFAFNLYAEKSDQVTFRFADGGTYSVPLSDCKSGNDKKLWS